MDEQQQNEIKALSFMGGQVRIFKRQEVRIFTHLISIEYLYTYIHYHFFDRNTLGPKKSSYIQEELRSMAERRPESLALPGEISQPGPTGKIFLPKRTHPLCSNSAGFWPVIILCSYTLLQLRQPFSIFQHSLPIL